MLDARQKSEGRLLDHEIEEIGGEDLARLDTPDWQVFEQQHRHAPEEEPSRHRCGLLVLAVVLGAVAILAPWAFVAVVVLLATLTALRIGSAILGRPTF